MTGASKGQNTAGPSLSDRPRLMALVFALRLSALGAALLMGSLVLLVTLPKSTGEWQALNLLFAYFVLLIGTVLVVLRVSTWLHRILILSPSLAFLFGHTNEQVAVAGLGVLLALEGYRREAKFFRMSPPYALSQAFWALTGLVAGRLQSSHAPAVTLLLSFLFLASFGYGCWAWQSAIKLEMAKLDVDES